MATKSTPVAGGGIGFLGALTIAFIVLKLCGAIAWSWFWVLSPVAIPLGIVVALVSLAAIVGGMR